MRIASRRTRGPDRPQVVGGRDFHVRDPPSTSATAVAGALHQAGFVGGVVVPGRREAPGPARRAGTPAASAPGRSRRAATSPSTQTPRVTDHAALHRVAGADGRYRRAAVGRSVDHPIDEAALTNGRAASWTSTSRRRRHCGERAGDRIAPPLRPRPRLAPHRASRPGDRPAAGRDARPAAATTTSSTRGMAGQRRQAPLEQRRPPRARNCFGGPPPARVPRPPAARIALTDGVASCHPPPGLFVRRRPPPNARPCDRARLTPRGRHRGRRVDHHQRLIVAGVTIARAESDVGLPKGPWSSAAVSRPARAPCPCGCRRRPRRPHRDAR